MKIIKYLFLVAVGIFANTLLQAQELKTQIAKPVESTVPPPGSKPVLAPDLKPEPKLISNAQKPESEFKIMETKDVPTAEVKAEDLKPQVVTSKNSIAVPPSTLATDTKDYRDRPIHLPAQSTNSTTTPPVKNETKKPVAAPVQQIEN